MCTYYLAYCGLAATSNGCAGVTRALRKHELPFYCNHLLRLRRQCRRSRFGNEVSDRFLRDYVGCIDLTNTAILGFFDGDEMRGAAELRSMRNVWCDAAEAAFSVEAQWRSRGIGGALMMDTLAMSRGLGVERVHLICERHNRAMLRIAEKVCADIRFEHGDCLSQITVPQRQSQEDPGPYFAAFSGVPSNNSATLPASREP
jgi:GNAT superfamily N-acetyltransferase